MLVESGLKEMEESIWTPEQCSNALWAVKVRKIEANFDDYPLALYRAMEHCRTANYY